MRKLLCLVALLLSLNTYAVRIQILHSNDIHSFVEHDQQTPHTGGYPRLKYQFDQLEKQAQQKGIKTIRVDLGDFLEGNLFYMAKEGARVFEIHSAMNYDMVVLGNHDYMMGTEQFNALLGKQDFNFSLLAANLKVKDKSRHHNIQNRVNPTRIIEVDGHKIGFIGLTAKELPYNWALESDNIKIQDPIKAANRYAKELKSQGVEYIVALSHLGLKKDQKLAKRSVAIDLIIGSHSHDVLNEPLYIPNYYSRTIPIVQAQAEGSQFGKLIVELDRDRGAQLLNYQLIKVNSPTQDQHMLNLVEKAKQDLYQKYGKEWLLEVVGHYRQDKNGHQDARLLSQFIAKAMREELKTDVAIHSPNFVQTKYLSENITRFDLLNLNPRIYSLDEPFGPAMYQIKMSGFLLRELAKMSKKYQWPITISGASSMGFKDLFRLYTVAIPADIYNAMNTATRMTKLMLNRLKPNKSCATLIQAMNNHIDELMPNEARDRLIDTN